jgi:hypothetical protein
MCSQVQTKNIFFYIVLMPDQFTIGSTVLVQEVTFGYGCYGCQRVVEEEVELGAGDWDGETQMPPKSV